MSKASLLEVYAENFRGIRRAALPLGGANLVMVGENGSGKSSFADLLEYLFTGQLARLRRQDVRERESIPFVGRSDGDPVVAKITVNLDGTEYEIGTGYPYVTPELTPPASDWLKDICAHPPILRRAQILEFVEAGGADRYRLISTIVGLSDVDEVLGKWRRLESETKRDQTTLRRSLQGLRDSMRGLLQVTGSRDLVEAVNHRLAEVGMPPITQIGELEERRSAFEMRADVTAAAQDAARLDDYAAAIEGTGTTVRDLLPQYAAFHAKWTEFAGQKTAWQDALFRELLDQGQKILAELPELRECPLCQAPIDSQELLRRLRPRIAALEVIRRRRDALEAEREKVRQAVARASQQVQVSLSGEYSGRVRSLDELAPILIHLDQALQSDTIDGQYPTPLGEDEEPWAGILGSLDQEIRSLRDEARGLKPSEVEQKRLEISAWLARAEEVWRGDVRATKQIEATALRCHHLELMVQALTHAREECLTGIHADIADRINHYYQEMHPEEGYGDIELPIERRGQAVGLRTVFHGVQDSHPLGHYSEGHLDCVGIAIFLAFCRRRYPEGGVLVLDDVMTTVDGDHRQRLAILLAREFSDFQVIITTHDRFWANELLTTMRAQQLRCQAIHLHSWSVESGVEWMEFLEQEWEEHIRRAGTNPQSAVGDAGRDLEKLLCTMRYNLRLSVAARHDEQYTIGDLYDPFFAWFRRRSVQNPDRDFDGELAEINQQLDVYWRQRNWCGAHYNTWGATVTPTEARDFIVLAQRLHALLQCPRCGSLVRYSEDSSVLYCAKCSSREDGAVWRTVRRAGGQ